MFNHKFTNQRASLFSLTRWLQGRGARGQAVDEVKGRRSLVLLPCSHASQLESRGRDEGITGDKILLFLQRLNTREWHFKTAV